MPLSPDETIVLAIRHVLLLLVSLSARPGSLSCSTGSPHQQRRHRHGPGGRRIRRVFGDRAGPMGQPTASEDFSDIPSALEVPYTCWGLGGIDAQTYGGAADAGRGSG